VLKSKEVLDMATGNETTSEAYVDALFGEATKNWGWMLALGILSVILGTIGLGMTFALTIAGVLLFGILFLIGGCFQLIQALKCKGWKGIVWHILIAFLYVIAGIIVIRNPVGASVMFTLVFAWILVAVGILRIITAIQMRSGKNWIWLLIAGIASIILGAIIIAKWPISGLWVIGLFIAVELILNGWSNILVALAARASGQAESTQAPATETA
jgi:uncharacterized membrane protein HdeD (DUF308 family)